ncbi:unnamed protein product [Acanthoscelides obtectus]|uniref:Uncharacterized protein n=1 Tax=Acanthoscelides obtectus TaxID=200917 RepID=A0A9P0PLB3_ACAOB|nr:unnamed protein product [Acanthoscelides obtectus]CAK1661187.1 hypothetical protein AOBTE_LOCUS22503 [Acanthoscelides obtectus]
MSTLARPPTYALGSFDSHWETASTPSAPRARREGLGRGGNNLLCNYMCSIDRIGLISSITTCLFLNVTSTFQENVHRSTFPVIVPRFSTLRMF